MADVHLTEPIHPEAEARLRGAGLTLSHGPDPGAMAAARAWLVRTAQVPAAAIAAAPRLQIVSKHGVGIDNIAIEAAQARGLWVTNTPGANAGAVAEHTLMLMLALARKTRAMDASARHGFAGRDAIGPVDLAGRRVLIGGFGAIGRRVARLCAAFEMQVTVYHRRLGAAEAGYAVTHDLAAALPDTDILSLHLPLTPETDGMIGAAELAALPAGAIVINTGRGGVVDEAALVAAAPRLGGIGLDVFAEEPLRPDDPLLGLPNALLSPHAAALSPDAFRKMGLMAAENVLSVLSGGRPPPERIVAAPPPPV